MSKTKILFNIINTIFIVFYLFPGSLFGLVVHGSLQKQPQLTSDFLSLSSNHVYAFLVLSLLGLIAYYKSKKLLILIYLTLSSILLEVSHFFIPHRSFQFDDLWGNIVGFLLSIILITTFNFWRKK